MGRPHNGTVDADPVEEPIPVTRAVASGTAKLMPDIDRAHAWLLTVDGAPQSYVDLDDPAHLEFEYARRIGHLLDAAPPPGAPLDVLHLGGGALTLPRYVAATRPGSRQRVADSDAGLMELVADHLPLPADSGIAVEAGDGRAVLEGAAEDSADVLIADVYGGSRVPPHLTTLPYAREAARVLRPGGRYVANLADAVPFRFLASQLATFAEVFAHLALMAEPAVLRGRRFGNIVLLASHEEQPLSELARRCSGDPFPARVEHGPALARFTRGVRPVHDGDAVPSPEPPDGAFSIG
ncbi:fused MFS/spermidine synthase [Streptomyces sp. NBC_01775]|uniref:spermidine synthase n=1 Tax=Streptomyces sp. NBC_01775 TaxID=2975939 RepID=UPI002DD805BD|nr:fused MFS/spermidine synthase [Streptomyces sp. NBC_01775]WSB81152.1 fused MFS/spermidine synthase [Streptomyces sp. NBC_01775]